MGVKEDLVELKRKISHLREEPEKFRAALAGLIVVLGFALIKMPLSARIEAKRVELHEAERLADIAERVLILREEAVLVSDRLDVPADLADWQGYLTTMVNRSGANLLRQEAGKVDVIYDFNKIEISLTITGSYRQIWAFVDAVERGPRLARLENIDLSISEGALTLRCVLLGLTRPDSDTQMAPDEEEEPLV